MDSPPLVPVSTAQPPLAMGKFRGPAPSQLGQVGQVLSQMRQTPLAPGGQPLPFSLPAPPPPPLTPLLIYKLLSTGIYTPPTDSYPSFIMCKSLGTRIVMVKCTFTCVANEWKWCPGYSNIHHASCCNRWTTLWIELNSSLYILADLASFPGPAQLSVASSTVKRERAWYLLSREWYQDRKSGRKGLVVHGHTGPRTVKRAKVLISNLLHIYSWREATVLHTECWVCSRLKICEMQPVRQIFAIFLLRHANVRKDTRLSPLYRTASDRKLGGAWEQGWADLHTRRTEYSWHCATQLGRRYNKITNNQVWKYNYQLLHQFTT